MIAFATGTSLGACGIHIPIALGVFSLTEPLSTVCVSVCMTGVVCGDRCSPISDTSIMPSAGDQRDYLTHVSIQLPYALIIPAISLAAYILVGFVPNVTIERGKKADTDVLMALSRVEGKVDGDS